MLRHIGLAAVAVALVTLTADTVHGRGGMRGHSTFRYNFGSGGYSAGDSSSGGSRTVSSHYRGSSATSSSSRKSSKSTGNSLSNEETSSTSTSTGAIANVTKRSPTGATGNTTPSTQQTTATTTSANSTPTSSTQTQPLVSTLPLGITPTLGIPLTQDPNTTADRTYRGLLHNAKELIRAGVYPAAINVLQRIINGAPGTRIAAEAERLLARIPTN